MALYKDLNGKIYDDMNGEALDLLPAGCVQVTQAEADAIRNPPKTAAQIYADKWSLIGEQISALTVTIPTTNNKYAANKEAMNEINIKISSLNGTETFAWYEEWGTFMTNKVELQEVVTLACQAEQAIIDQIMVV